MHEFKYSSRNTTYTSTLIVIHHKHTTNIFTKQINFYYVVKIFLLSLCYMRTKIILSILLLTSLSLNIFQKFGDLPISKKEQQRITEYNRLKIEKEQLNEEHTRVLDKLYCEKDSLLNYYKNSIYIKRKRKEHEENNIIYINSPFQYQFDVWSEDTKNTKK